MDKIRYLATTAVILYNMIVEARRGGYSSDGTAGQSNYFDENDDNNEITFINSSPGETPLFSNSSVAVNDDIEVKGMHRELKSALIEHQWMEFGGSDAK